MWQTDYKCLPGPWPGLWGATVDSIQNIPDGRSKGNLGFVWELLCNKDANCAWSHRINSSWIMASWLRSCRLQTEWRSNLFVTLWTMITEKAWPARNVWQLKNQLSTITSVVSALWFLEFTKKRTLLRTFTDHPRNKNNDVICIMQ